MGALHPGYQELLAIEDLAPARKQIIYHDKQLVVSRTRKPAGLKFAGEIDSSNAHAITQSVVAGAPAEGDVHLDVTSLIFIDISGIRAVVSAAENLSDGRRILLHELPAQLARVMSIVGWAEAPTLAICDCNQDILM
jgi:anti-anti-sigma factor